MNRLQKWLAIGLTLVVTGCALWLYRFEPTVKVDPNDNAFQYALIDRTNTMWDFGNRTCPKTIAYIPCHISILIDHWVPNWAEGYNLPYYYSHIPQITIVGSYRFLQFTHIIPVTYSLFQYYHLVIYLLLASLPIILFLAFRIMSMSYLASGLAALFALLISTDGLYGIDQTSFLWRGWGLSSQLFALIWMPLAIASAVAYHHQKKRIYAIMTAVFLTATTAGHLGIGMMTWMAIAVISCTPVVIQILDRQSFRHILRQCGESVWEALLLLLPTVVILSYWIIPVFTGSQYHNTSLWDPVWKFNSFGVIDAVTKLCNGALFDFGRFPLMTGLVLFGLVDVLTRQDDQKQKMQPIGILFLFFFAMFFGRTTWGRLIDLIPGMSDFHGHRFIVGIHMAGLFLAPIGLMFIIERTSMILQKLLKVKRSAFIKFGTTLVLMISSCWILVPHIIDYISYNNTLIVQANAQFEEAKPDFERLVSTLATYEKKAPGRIYGLRGTEGGAFRIASSAYYMTLSTIGFPTVLWLPETWSANSDTEQFFTEENPDHYVLYNIRYVVAPPDKKPQPFWTVIQKTPHWILYEVDIQGYVDGAYAPSVVGSDKTYIINLIHLWIQSKNPTNNIYPELMITKTLPKTITIPHFQMRDLNTYETPDGAVHSLMGEQPIYADTTKQIPAVPMKITNQSDDTDMQFTANVEVTNPCPSCVVILRQTYHPNWHVSINGKPAQAIEVFPSFVAVRIAEPGTYTVTFTYTPSTTKIILLALGGIGIIGVWFLSKIHRRKK